MRTYDLQFKMCYNRNYLYVTFTFISIRLGTLVAMFICQDIAVRTVGLQNIVRLRLHSSIMIPRFFQFYFHIFTEVA